MYFYLNDRKKYTDHTNNITLEYSDYFNLWIFLNIQGQKINHYLDLKLSIANAILELLEKKIFVFPIKLSPCFILMNIEYFVYNVKEIEFYFDFRQENVQILNPESLRKIHNTFYSGDYRNYPKRPTRKSFLETYNHADRLKQQRRISWKKIEKNPYKQRIEFNLTKYNNRNLTLNDLSGNYHDVITRYSSYLSILYYRYFYGKVVVNDVEHPYFNRIYQMAKKGLTRYRGNELEKSICQKISREQNIFWCTMNHMLFIEMKKKDSTKSKDAKAQKTCTPS
jgi:hypothetical protein